MTSWQELHMLGMGRVQIRDLILQRMAYQCGFRPMESRLFMPLKKLKCLTRIQNEARSKSQYGVAGKMEELKGKVQGFYIDRNMTLTKEVTEEDLNEKMRSMFDSKEEYEAVTKAMTEEIFGKKD